MFFRRYRDFKKQQAHQKSFEEFMVMATDLANRLLQAHVSRHPASYTLMQQTWEKYFPIVPTSFKVMHDVSEQLHGALAVKRTIMDLTENISDAPIAQPSSRSIICEMLYAMEDNDARRCSAAWAKCSAAENGWPVAEEVMMFMMSTFSRMLSRSEQQ